MQSGLHAICSMQSQVLTKPICSPAGAPPLGLKQLPKVNVIETLPPSVTKAHQLLLCEAPTPLQGRHAVGFEKL